MLTGRACSTLLLASESRSTGVRGLFEPELELLDDELLLLLLEFSSSPPPSSILRIGVLLLFGDSLSRLGDDFKDEFEGEETEDDLDALPGDDLREDCADAARSKLTNLGLEPTGVCPLDLVPISG